MKPAFIAINLAACVLFSGCADHDDLGPLANFYHDCVGSRGPRQSYVRATLRRALAGDQTALHAVLTDNTDFGTGDNEAYSELPGILLGAVGDARYAEFVLSQTMEVQTAALSLLSPDQIPDFRHAYPRTAKLFYRQRHKHTRTV